MSIPYKVLEKVGVMPEEISHFQRGYQTAQNAFATLPLGALQKRAALQSPSCLHLCLSKIFEPSSLSNDMRRDFVSGWRAFLQEGLQAEQSARPLPPIQERPDLSAAPRASRETCLGGHHTVCYDSEEALDKPEATGKLFNVWHIAQNGDVYPVATAIEETEATKIADALQDLSFVGIVPETFYLAVPIGKDTDWIERMASNSTPAPVDYMQEYLVHPHFKES